MKSIPENPTPKDLKGATRFFLLNIVATIVLFVLYSIARQRNFVDDINGNSATYFSRMKFCLWLGILNTAYTLYLSIWWYKIRQRVKKQSHKSSQ